MLHIVNLGDCELLESDQSVRDGGSTLNLVGTTLEISGSSLQLGIKPVHRGPNGHKNENLEI